MKTKVDLSAFDNSIVYVKPVDVADLPEDVRIQAGDLDRIYAVHSAKGDQIALVANEDLAVALARQHDMQAVTLH